jgi:hypothetical protein
VKTQIVVICFYSQFCLKKIKTYPVSKQLSIHLENTEKKYLKKMKPNGCQSTKQYDSLLHDSSITEIMMIIITS